VLVETSLFILFGMSSKSVVLDDMLVLDVASSSNITIVSTYPYATKASSPAIKEAPDENGDEESLSTGAIIGISVSCAITVRTQLLYYCYMA
jgi:hypothetical protein